MTGQVTGGYGRWFQPPGIDPEARARIFLLPCAGGNAQMFRDWYGLFPADVAAQAVQFPGRLDRRDEPPYTAMKPLIEAMTEAFAAELDDRPYAFFGHSMGALIAYRLCVALEQELGSGPVLVGSAGWSLEGFAAPTQELLDLPDDELINWVVSLGSLPEAIYRDPDMLTLTIPPTRADLAACLDYADDGARMSCAVVTYSGRSDPLVAGSAMESWAARSRAYLGHREFDGGHFFIYHAAQSIAADLTYHLQRAIVAPTA